MEGPEEGKFLKKSEHLDVKLEGYSNSLWRLKGEKVIITPKILTNRKKL